MILDAVPAFQAILNSNTGEQIGVEVLARWIDGVVCLKPFDLAAKQDIDWGETDIQIMKSLAHSIHELNQSGFSLFINVSEQVLESDTLFSLWKEQLVELLWRTEVPVVIEILETTSEATLDKRWSDLAGLGVLFALDDYGCHGATMERLKKRPWSYCKFDMQASKPCNFAEAVKYCNENKILAIAEKVEFLECADKAQSFGITHHQGFLYGLPTIMQIETVE